MPKRSSSEVTSLSKLVIPKAETDPLHEASFGPQPGYFSRFSALYEDFSRPRHALSRFLDSLEGPRSETTIRTYHTQVMVALRDFFYNAYALPTPEFDDVAAFLMASDLCRNADSLEAKGKLTPRLNSDLQRRLDTLGGGLSIPSGNNKTPALRTLLPNLRFAKSNGTLHMELRGDERPPRTSEIHKLDERVVNTILGLLDDDGRKFWMHFFKLDVIGKVLGVGRVKRDNSNRTINLRHAALKSFETYLLDSLESEHREIMPRVKRCSEPLKQKPILNDEQMNQVLTKVREKANEVISDLGWMKIRDLALFLVLDYTGLRAGALCAIKLKHLNLEKQTLYVPREKREKSRIMPLHDDAVRELKCYLRVRERKLKRKGIDPQTAEHLFISKTGRPLSPRHLEDLIHKTIVDAGVGLPPFGRWGPHSWRHSVATFIFKRSGYNISKVQEFLNHSSPNTSQIYILGARDSGMLHDTLKDHPRAGGLG